MKIGIITDAHLFRKYAIRPEQYKEIIQKLDVDIIIDCGDLTDKNNLTAPEIDILSKLYEGVNKQIYYVSGNHDSLSGTTTASIFNNLKNVKIITEPYVIDNLLFIPYTDNILQLYKNLDKIVKEPLLCAFSHLNITSNFYANIPINKSKNLFKYAKYYFNGHIHMPEKYNSAYGTVYNIGSCSNITFGDSHIPCYSIFDTKIEELRTINIKNSVVHRVFNNIEDINIEDNSYLYRYKINLPNNNESLSKRQQILDKFLDKDKIIDIVFDYVRDKEIKKQEKKEIAKKQNLMQQLFEYFENDMQIKLHEDIKKELLL